ncbi:MAG: hypothetical protein AB7P24_17365, partial [Nitrospira sp.]
PDAKYCGVTKERSDHQGRDRVPRVSPRPNNEQLYTPNNLQSDILAGTGSVPYKMLEYLVTE